MQHCNNCDKSLTSQKFDLHLGYCRRNIKRCVQCNLPYDVNNIEEHNEQYHKFQKCKHCQKSLNVNQIKDHQKNCLARPIACIYCQLPVPADKFQYHRVQCQAKTTSCQFCQKLIINREIINHRDKCLSSIGNQVKIESTFNQKKQKVNYPTFKQQQKKENNSYQRQQHVDLNKFLFETQDHQLQAALLASLDFSLPYNKVTVKNS